MVTNRDPATDPANVTVPSATPRTRVPKSAPMSMPRCPDENGVGGGSNPRNTGPHRGHNHEPAGGEVAARAVPMQISPATATARAPTRVRLLMTGATRPSGTRRPGHERYSYRDGRSVTG